MLRLYFLPYWIWDVGSFVICTITSNDHSGNFDTSSRVKKNPARARIINGESVSGREYPFLAQVHLKVCDGKKNTWYASGGSIVTKSIILTCGHCVCIGPNTKDAARFVTCPIDDKFIITFDNKPRNQNQKGKNEVYYSIGTQKFDYRSATHSSDIYAYLFKYEPFDEPGDQNQILFSKNGDIAAIKDVTMDLIGYKATHITLPTFNAFLGNDGKDVKIAGRGPRYDEYVDNEHNPPRSLPSCITNGGLVKNRQMPANQHNIFIPCKDWSGPPPNRDVCINIPDTITTFHANTKVIIRPNFHLVQLVPNKDVCDDYWKEAIKYIEKEEAQNPGPLILTSENFKNMAHRIVVHDAGPQTPDRMMGEICYNVKKLAEFGVCETDMEPPNDWGFCSKSCGLPPKISDEHSSEAQFSQYEMIGAKYFDIPPPESELFSSGNFITNFICNFNVILLVTQ